MKCIITENQLDNLAHRLASKKLDDMDFKYKKYKEFSFFPKGTHDADNGIEADYAVGEGYHILIGNSLFRSVRDLLSLTDDQTEDAFRKALNDKGIKRIALLHSLDFSEYRDMFVSEVRKVEDFSENIPEYYYDSIGVLPNEFDANKIGAVFFHGPKGKYSEYKQPQTRVKVYFFGNKGDFEFDSNDILRTKKDGIPFVKSDKLTKQQYEDLLPLLRGNVTQNFTGKDILSALEMAFPNNWVEENEDFTSGIRGIHTIGEKNGTDEDWSIMNYFDTKSEIKGLIDEKWKNEGSGNKIEWLSSVFENDKDFLNKLLKIQWNSIKNGVETENKALDNLIKSISDKNLNFDYEVYSPGHKKDRYDATDIKITVEGSKPFTIQIKPYDKVEELPNGETKVYTYGMRDSYKEKYNLNYILYNKGDNFIIFKNKNYMVDPESGGKIVIHKDKPSKSS
jgi:hypothetical protein